jgi:hypothetical protein
MPSAAVVNDSKLIGEAPNDPLGSVHWHFSGSSPDAPISADVCACLDGGYGPPQARTTDRSAGRLVLEVGGGTPRAPDFCERASPTTAEERSMAFSFWKRFTSKVRDDHDLDRGDTESAQFELVGDIFIFVDETEVDEGNEGQPVIRVEKASYDHTGRQVSVFRSEAKGRFRA